MNIGLQYKLRTLIECPKDLFYSMIWPYIPKPPTGPPPEYNIGVMSLPIILSGCEFQQFFIYKLFSMWKIENNVTSLLNNYSDITPYIAVCCICEHRPSLIGIDVFHINTGYQICIDCNELIKDDPDFFK